VRGLSILGTVCWLGLLGAQGLHAQRVDCTLIQEVDGTFKGTCQGFDEGTASLELGPDKPVTGASAPMALPTDVRWTGPLRIKDWPMMQVEVVSSPYTPDPLPVMKTDVAWLLLENAIVQDLELSFWFQFDEDAPPTVDDLEIIEGAIGILNHEIVWDRSANRRCRSSTTTWTLYCALHDATIEVTGEFHEYQPAMVITSDVIDRIFREMEFERPLIDYNTYADAILIEMHRLLTMAGTRIRGQI